MGEHTPGSWRLVRSPVGCYMVVVADMKQFREIMVEGVDFGEIPGTNKPTLLKPGAENTNEPIAQTCAAAHSVEQVNGRLLAAAPDLLAACKAGMLDLIELGGCWEPEGQPGICGRCDGCPECAGHTLHAAIAKVEGKEKKDGE